MDETAVTFSCQRDGLLGVLHRGAVPGRSLGVLVVVGGPQYRVGSHRQFVMMARSLAEAGYPVFRFDYRGMGDSEGDVRAFDQVDEDIRAAVDAFVREMPGLDGVVIFGLCDAASAAMIYCYSDQRVRGLILANPWVRSAEGQARAYLKHYYGRRLFERAFWQKVLRGEFDARGSLGDVFDKLRRAGSIVTAQPPVRSFIQRMEHGLGNFGGQVLLLMSDSDLTAREFDDLCAASHSWRRLMARTEVRRHDLQRADHTFSSSDSLRRANQICIDWLRVVSRTSSNRVPSGN